MLEIDASHAEGGGQLWRTAVLLASHHRHRHSPDRHSRAARQARPGAAASRRRDRRREDPQCAGRRTGVALPGTWLCAGRHPVRKLRVPYRNGRQHHLAAAGTGVSITPAALQPLQLEPGAAVTAIRGIANVATLPLHIASRMRNAALARLGDLGGTPQVEPLALDRSQANGPGAAIVLWAKTRSGLLGAGRVAQRGVCAEVLGEAPAAALRADWSWSALRRSTPRCG